MPNSSKTIPALAVAAWMLLTPAADGAPGPADPARPCYLFSYFTRNGQDGLRLASSRDGLTWKPVREGKPLLRPQIGKDKLMRDPCIVRGPDGVFHMVWTTGWWDRGIGVAHSKDLIHWSPQRRVGVMEHEPQAKNCWAPELFYDAATKRYLIFWATTIPGRFPKTQRKGDHNHRMYCTTTSDFQTYTRTRLFYEPGVNVIDATIVKVGGRHLMFIKDETRQPPAKTIRLAWADAAAGPYGPLSGPITGTYWCEGPSAIRIGGFWYVYFDKYRKHRYGALRSPDLKRWQDVSRDVRFPAGARHGTVFEVPPAVWDKLLTAP